MTELHADGRHLVFSLCGEHYAVELAKVKEVIAWTETTPIPFSPAYTRGIINLRGQVISIIDLRLKFKVGKSDVTPETAIVILDLAPLCLGVVVSSVESVMAFNASEISQPPDIETSAKREFLRGVARKDNKLILMLDIASTLNLEDLNLIKSQSEHQKSA